MKNKIYVVLASEFVATFLFVFWIILPGSLGFGVNPNLSDWWNNLYNFVFSTYLTKAIWTAGFLVIILYMFRGISSNVNPAVTLSQYFTGRHDGIKATLMILTQFIAAMSAALLMLLVCNLSSIDWWNESNNLSSVYPKLEFNGWIANTFGYNTVLIDLSKNNDFINNSYIIVTIALECALTYLLILSVNEFNDVVNHSIKPLFISGTLVIILLIGYHTNNICVNPARITASALISSAAGHGNAIIYLPAFIFGEFLASMAFIKFKGE